MNSKYDTYTQKPASAYPSLAVDEDVILKEVSHVFHCMQCDLQFQMDMAMISGNGTHEINEEIVRVRLDPHVKMG